MAACRSWAVDDAANPSDDSNSPQIEVVRVKPTDPTSPKLRFQLNDGSVDLMKPRSLGGVDALVAPGRCRLPTRPSTRATANGKPTSSIRAVADTDPPRGRQAAERVSVPSRRCPNDDGRDLPRRT